ncbi:MAG: hypothetical protein V4465_00650 [Patescibacteria group bacterium]
MQGSPLASAVVGLLIELETDEWWEDDKLVNLCKFHDAGQKNVQEVLILVSKDRWEYAHLWWPAVEHELTRKHSMDDEWYRDFVYGACFAVFQLRAEAFKRSKTGSEFVAKFPHMVSSMIFADRGGPSEGSGKNPFSPIFDEMLRFGLSSFSAEELQNALGHVSAEYKKQNPEKRRGADPRGIDAMDGRLGSVVIKALFYALAQKLHTGQRADLIISMGQLLSVK